MTSRRNVVLGLLALPALAGCKIVKNGDQSGKDAAQNGTDGSQGTRVASDWDRRILPYVEKKAAPLQELRASLSAQPDQTIRKHGHAAGNGAKPVVFASFQGVVVDADTATRAATIAVDTTGDGRADVTVQVGPVIRGSALRDGLDFIDFSQFGNQIDFAEYAKALNAHVRDVVLNAIDRNALKGKHVRVTGAFFIDPATPMPLVTPVKFALGGAP